jgi:predicted ATPase
VLQPEQVLLRSLQIRPHGAWPDRFPYTVATLRHLERLDFTTPVTYLVGENGSGKSTFLETLACAVGSITVGSEQVERDRSLAPLRDFAARMQLVWTKRTRRGFFLRAEDFFGYARKMEAMAHELEEDLADVDRDYAGRSPRAQAYARSAYAGQLGALRRDYGQGLDARSHGESFLALFQARFVPNGLYLLDEPEAPLSPLRQLTFLALLNRMVKEGAQFIIATHSPILLAFPGATIYSFDELPVRAVAYEALAHVQLTRQFLAHPDQFLQRLFADEE